MPDPQFQEPWQAQVFSLVVALQDACVISKTEWADALGAAIREAQQAGDADRGDTYYGHWVSALEEILEARGIASHAQLHDLAHAWQDAAERTPHGKPIELDAAAMAIAKDAR